MHTENKEFKIELKSEKDLLDWLKKNQSLLQNKVIRIHGEMGAGKTTLVRLYLSLVAPENEEGTSPTFALHHRYTTSLGSIDHFDLYRLESSEELEGVGFWDTLKDAKMAFVEWPDKVPKALWPQNHCYVDLYLELKGSARFLIWFSL